MPTFNVKGFSMTVKTNIDRSNNAYSKYARFGARRGLLQEVCIEVLNLAILNLSRK